MLLVFSLHTNLRRSCGGHLIKQNVVLDDPCTLFITDSSASFVAHELGRQKITLFSIFRGPSCRAPQDEKIII